METMRLLKWHNGNLCTDEYQVKEEGNGLILKKKFDTLTEFMFAYNMWVSDITKNNYKLSAGYESSSIYSRDDDSIGLIWDDVLNLSISIFQR